MLSKDELSTIQANEVIKQLRSIVLDSNSFLKIVKIFLDNNENIEEQIKEKKKDILPTDIFNKVVEHEHLLKSYFILLVDPKGYYLFNKIFSNDENYNDESFEDIYKAIILNIIKTDFIDLFNYHEYYLNLINKLSKVSLKILIEHKNWPTNVSGPTIHISSNNGITDWEKRFANEYAKTKDSKEIIYMDIIFKCVIELRDFRIIQYAKNINDRKVSLTDSGEKLLKYLILD